MSLGALASCDTCAPGFSIYADLGRYCTAWGLSLQAGVADSAVNPPVRPPKRANLARANSKTMDPGGMFIRYGTAQEPAAAGHSRQRVAYFSGCSMMNLS